jgi:hypothetical protein
MTPATEMFDDGLLESYASTRYGYGSYSGRYWFIGKEEGGGKSFEEVNRRLNVWRNEGGSELDDLYEFHIKIGVRRFFLPPVALGATWGRLVRILLAAEAQAVTKDEVKDYQAGFLGRRAGDTCLLELLPLPSPGGPKWLCRERSKLAQLRTRKAYKKHYAETRASHVKERINEYAPRAVIFYSDKMSYRQWWEEIAGVDFSEVEPGALYAGTSGATVFLITKHPAGGNVSHQYLQQAGQHIRRLAQDG